MKKLLKNLFKNSLQKGFTLIELLVVIAVLGVLATIVLLAVNPGEQLARARDTSRIAAVTQLGRALQAYYTAVGGTFTALTIGNDWMAPLTTSQDLKNKPSNPSFSGGTPATNCTIASYGQTVGVVVGNAGGYCYNRSAAFDNAVVYSTLESKLYGNKCTTGVPFSVFSTADSRFGVVCATTDPTVGPQSFIPTP